MFTHSLFTRADHVIVNALSDHWSSVDEYGNYHVTTDESKARKLFDDAGLSDRIPAVGNERQLTPHLVVYNNDGGELIITLTNTRATPAPIKKRGSRASKKARREPEGKEFEFAGYKFTSGPRGTIIKRKYI